MIRIDLQLFAAPGRRVEREMIGSTGARSGAIASRYGQNYLVADGGQRSRPGTSAPTERVTQKKNEIRRNPMSYFKMPTFNYGGGGGSYGGSGLSKIGAFAPSDSYNQAMAYTNQLLEKLNSGRTSYSDRIDSLMNTIANRDKFSYDFNTDPLFQNALASAMQSGQTAMQDTMGQASALTGGYGSSYATSAANQAYNGFIQDAYSDLPQYYNMALQAYEMEGNELYNQLGMWRDADDSEYNRLYNAYNINYGQAQDMYNREYSNYWDTANYNLGVDQYNNDMAYKYASLNESVRQYNQSMAYNQYKDALAAYEKLSSGSSSGSDTTKEMSVSQMNAIKGDLTDIAKTKGPKSDAYLDALAMYRNNYNLTDDQIREINAAVQGGVPLEYTLIEAGRRNLPAYMDQFGNNYLTSSKPVSFQLVDNKGNNGKSKDSVYADPVTGQKYTYEELKNKGWLKYIRGVNSKEDEK